ncbi:MAG: methyltransferase protein, partial [Phycisphaerales bacterium]|nr:methyltransferase protein [Phycisphaerales bacterium]
AKVDGQSACCSPVTPAKGGLPIAGAGCCSSAEPATVHQELAELLKAFDLNAFAASMKIYATKPA